MRSFYVEVERGQVFVIGGLLIAVVFVGLALTINSAIYAENLGARETSETGSCSGLHVQEQLTSETARLIDERNAHTTTMNYSKLDSQLETDFDAYTTSVTRTCAERGISVDSKLGGTSEGIRLRQTNISRDFTSKHGDWNWNLTGDSPGAGQFAMTLQSTSLWETDLDTLLATLASEAFAIEFHLHDYTGSGDGVWRIYFFQSTLTDNVDAVVEYPNQTFADDSLTKLSGILDQACSARGDNVTLRLRAGMYGGQVCSEFSFYNNIDDHTVSYQNARVKPPLSDDVARARGSYNILLETANHNTSAFNDAGAGQPFHQSAITELDYRLSVDTGESSFEISNGRVKPMNDSVGGITRYHPRIGLYHVSDETNGDPSFTIEHNVFDEDGDLDVITVYMIHKSDEKIVDSATYSNIDTVEDSGTVTLTDTRLTASEGDTYLLVIAAMDEEGRGTMTVKTKTAG